ncbi:MAG: ribonuclease III [Bacteroidia bacterium]
MALWRSSNKKDDFTDFIKSVFGLKPKDLSLYKTAVTHGSITKSKWDNYERLEFLGDTILDTIVAEFLFNEFPKKTEGELTQMKSVIVSRDALNKVGKELQLKRFIKTSLGNQKNRYIEGNVLEALFGAIFLDHGYKKTKQAVVGVLSKHLNLKEIENVEADYKSQLYQWCQKHKKSLDKSFSSFEKDGSKHYNVAFFIDNLLVGQGDGTSKKTAEKIAAENAIKNDALSKFSVKK